MTSPGPNDAARLTAQALGAVVTDVRRFTTGLHHFVYEVTLADGRAVVMRMSRPSERPAIRNAIRLSQELRPRGVPLPELLAFEVEDEFPWMLLERLPGTDLGEVVAGLSDDELRAVAGHVGAAQKIAAGMPTAGRYGYAPSAAEAPFERWSDVVAAHIARSRGRIEAVGLFDVSAVERLEGRFVAMRPDLDRVAPTPFLHDTTTKNVIVADGRFSGIVDVDDLCFGDPRYVAALIFVALQSLGTAKNYADHLMRAAGWQDDHLFRLYVAAFLLDFMSEHGQRFNDNERESSRDERATLLARYEAALVDL